MQFETYNFQKQSKKFEYFNQAGVQGMFYVVMSELIDNLPPISLQWFAD